jgi:uncharacterized protein YndB with AHSA1/START domain
MISKPIIKQIKINATAEKVWQVLLEPEMYQKWAKEFSLGSYYINSENLAVGSKVVFTDDSIYGLIGKVTINETNKQIQFTYEGQISNGVEDYTSEDVINGLKGSTETYILSESEGITTLEIDAPMGEAWYDDMILSWDKALTVIKELAESKDY